MYRTGIEGKIAALVDHNGRFVMAIGETVRCISVMDDGGLAIYFNDSCGVNSYRYNKILEAAKEAGLELVFLPPRAKIADAPEEPHGALIKGIAKAHVCGYTALNC